MSDTTQPTESPTQGQRIRAAKEQKAKEKQKKRGRDADALEAQATDVLQQTASWMGNRKGPVIAVVGAIVVGLGGLLGWSVWRETTAGEASNDIEDGIRAGLGEVNTTGQVAEGDDSEVFATESEQWSAMAKRFRAVYQEANGSEGKAWALLGVGQAELRLGHLKKAKQAYTEAQESTERNSYAHGAATEGLGRTAEAGEKLDAAAKHYDALSKHDVESWKPHGSYHLARIRAAQGKAEDAKQILAKLHETLNAADYEGPDATFLKEQVALRLRAIDPEAVEEPASTMSQAEIQRLLQQLRQGGGGLPAGL